MNEQIQMALYDEFVAINLGWTYKKVIIGENVVGFNEPTGYSPFGNAARIDFRNLTLVNN